MDSIAAGGGGVGGGGYADSLDSSPRSRGGDDSWDEPFPSSSSAAGGRLRLMCSYSGRIVPRPTDKSLCYLGGETRIVVADRHCSLADLHARLARVLPLPPRPFHIKYQLPSEDLDSLISVTTDEDLDNLVDEYDRLLHSGVSGKGEPRSSRLRLFIFPSKTESAPSSIGSLLDDSKSESWFVDALNGAMAAGGIPRGLSGDSASVNSLLGLVEDSSVYSRGGGERADPPEQIAIALARLESSGRLASVPDSPMMENTSSFGSSSSIPSLSNLPPIRTRADQDLRAVEDHFTHMNISSAAVAVPATVCRPEESMKEDIPQQSQPLAIPIYSNLETQTTISLSENPTRVFSNDEKSDHDSSLRMPQPRSSVSADPTGSDSISRQPVFYNERAPVQVTAGNMLLDQKHEFSVPVPGYGVQIQVPDQSYMRPQMQVEQLQHPQQQPKQFIQANPQYVRHASGSTVFSMPSYFPVSAHPMQQHQQAQMFDRQIPMYYVPVQQNPAPAYNLNVQPALADSTTPSPMVKPAMPIANTSTPQRSAARTTMVALPGAAPVQSQLIHIRADQSQAYAGLGYQLVHSQAANAMPSNYGYEFADPNHQQIYYAQPGAPAMQPVYQAVGSTAPTIPDPQPADLKQGR